MEREIELINTIKRKETRIVEFPIYRKHGFDSDLSRTVIYTRINENLSAISISKTQYDNKHKKIEYEIEFAEKYVFDSSEIDYHLGLGIYASSKKEFCDILNELEKTILEFKKAI